MDKIEKFLRKISKHDRDRVEHATVQLFRRDLNGLDWRKLKGYEHLYRIRTGDYRIIYYDDGEKIILKAVKRRDESTYHRF